MPTANPRITITLEPSLHAVLRRMSELTGNSQSAIVSELLGTSRPVFERVVAALEAAREIKDTANDEIAAGLRRAQDRLEGQLGLMLEAIDEANAPLLAEVEKVQRRRAGAGGSRAAGGTAAVSAPGGSTPVPVTRGSGGPRRGASGGLVSVPTSAKRGKKGAGGGRV